METKNIYVNVPKIGRDKARKYGALFDTETRKWYITPDCRYNRDCNLNYKECFL